MAARICVSPAWHDLGMFTPQPPPPRHCRLTPADVIAGTWRTHALAAEDAVSKVANDIPVEYAAALSVNPATAHLLLSEFVQLKAGDVVVQNAANSAVGQAVIQLAKLRGVKTVSIIRDRADYKQVVEQLKALGGDVVVSEEFARSAEMKTVLADLAPARLALNGAGGASSTELVRLLGQSGTMVTYGGMSQQPVVAATSALIFKDVTLKGFWLSHWNKTHTAAQRAAVLSTLAVCVCVCSGWGWWGVGGGGWGGVGCLGGGALIGRILANSHSFPFQCLIPIAIFPIRRRHQFAGPRAIEQAQARARAQEVQRPAGGARQPAIL